MIHESLRERGKFADHNPGIRDSTFIRIRGRADSSFSLPKNLVPVVNPVMKSKFYTTPEIGRMNNYDTIAKFLKKAWSAVPCILINISHSLRRGASRFSWNLFPSYRYGDIAPRGVPGRLFAIVWILCGLVIIAIFTSVVTTSLTVVTLSTTKNLYGSMVYMKVFKYIFDKKVGINFSLFLAEYLIKRHQF